MKKPADKAKNGMTSNNKKHGDITVLNSIAERAFFMALRMIDIANSRPDIERGEPKVGGHPTACGSSQHILTAIHMVTRNPEDYMAFKPHISPMDHALNCLLHNFWDNEGNLFSNDQRKLAMRHLRHYSREGEPVFQSYHAEADPDSWRYFPSGSVGIPPVNALYTALAYDFAKDHKFDLKEDPTFWCVMGDSEFREGSLHEAMPDAGERRLGSLIWIVDYNRQNLDGTRVFNESAMGGTDAERIAKIGEANGWKSVVLKHGKLRQRLFSTKGGDEFKRVLDEELSDFEFQSLLGSKKIDLIRQTLGEKSTKLKIWLKDLSDDELGAAFTNLAGHDLEILIETFNEAKKDRKRPTLIVPYTIKGYHLKVAALSGNHSAMPEEDELREMAEKLGADFDDPFEGFAEDSAEEEFLKTRRNYLTNGIRKLRDTVETRKTEWRKEAAKIEFPVDFDISALKFNPVAHTQWMWGQIAAKIDRLARGDRGTKQTDDTTGGWADVARFFLTMAPDVGSSTNTSPNMNGKLYGDIGQEDFELEYGAKDEKAPDIIPHASQRSGHIRFEIAEGNCMSAAGSFGKFFHFTGVPFYPAMTIYDFFIKRALDQYYYNVYWHSDFAVIGTPSGVTLAPEGAQHSWKSDIQMPNAVTWEPCFAKELEWILADILRRHFTRENEERECSLLRLVTKGQVQKEFLDRLKRQLRFKANTEQTLTAASEKTAENISENQIWETVRVETLAGGYPLIDYRGYDDYTPGDNVVHIFAMGALVTEAIRASDELLKKGIYGNVFVVTSSDLLLGNYAEKNNYHHLKETLGVSGDLHLLSERMLSGKADWLALQGGRIPIVSVHDGEPGLLDNIGSIVGVKQKCLAIRKTSKSGTTKDIFYYHHINAEGITAAVEEILTETANERIRIRQTAITSEDSSSDRAEA